MKKFIILFSVFLSLVSLFTLFGLKKVKNVYAFNLSDVENAIGGDIIYSGNEANLNITQPFSGVWEIKANGFACTPGTPNCEPERYEVRFNKKISHIYGLGMIALANQVELEDFLDGDFSSGHCLTPTNKFGFTRPTIDFYEADICRMRTPIFVFPTENLIIAYLQPWPKRLRLSREGQYGCPSQNTCLVLKKREDYNEGEPAPLVVVKGNDIGTMYSRYFQYLRQRGRYLKKPIYSAFGVAWETIEEFVNTATADDINNVVNHFKNNGIKLSMLTIGSGYWGTVTYNGVTCPENCVGCAGIAENGCPATDSLVVSSIKFPSPPGLSGLFENLFAEGIYPIIGMRHRIQKGITGFDNKTRIANILHSPPYSVPLNISVFYKNESTPFTFIDLPGIPEGDSKEMYLLNLDNELVKNAWANLIADSYGPFRGLKIDDMVMSDQKALCPTCSQRTNLPDDFFARMYPVYNQKYNNDFLIYGRMDWFSAGADLQNGQGWLGLSRIGPEGIEYNGYRIKLFLDSAFTQVVSGYPHPMLEPNVDPCVTPGRSDCVIPPVISREKEFVRTLQLQTFMPVMNHSRGFWHLTDQNYQNTVIFFSKLKNRLQQYSYDHAQRWYETGILSLVRLLFFDYPNDEIAYNLYQYAGNDRQTPWDEFMFGNALLVRPVFSDDDTFKVYLPGGSESRWRYFFESGKPSLSGGQMITYTIEHAYDFPVFLKEGEILIIGDSDTSKNPLPLYAYVFLENKNNSSVYFFYPRNGGKIRLQAFKNPSGEVVVRNLDNNREVVANDDSYNKGFKVAAINSLVSPEDLNGDGQVNSQDIKILLSKYSTNDSQADLNSDGKVNGVDFGWMVKF